MDKEKKTVQNIITQYETKTGLSCYYFPVNKPGLSLPPICEVCSLICQEKTWGQVCKKQRQNAIRRVITDRSWSFVFCETGVIEWMVPLVQDGIVQGIFLSGGVRVNTDMHEDTSAIISDIHSVCPSVDFDKLKPASKKIPWKTKGQIMSFCHSLITLCKESVEASSNQTPSRTVHFHDMYLGDSTTDKEESFLSLATETQPLSHYICRTLSAPDTLVLFWKTIEHLSSGILPNIYADRISEARNAFLQTMEYAMRENSLSEARISAACLLFIIFLKYFNKEVYDTRFYVLFYQAISELSQAENKQVIKDITNDVFHKMCVFFGHPSNKDNRISPAVLMMNFIDHNYDQAISVEDIARSAYLSKTYASNVFKKQTSVSIKNYLTSRRMIRAFDLLIRTSMSISSIAQKVGYSDMRSFYKTFSSYYGMKCTEVRNKYAIYEKFREP